MTWHVLGDGPELEVLKKKCKELPANISVKFYGNLSPNEVNNFYKTVPVNLFVSLSSSEGLPVSMMEAISFGIPMLCTNVGGCSEICNENTGLLINKEFDFKETAQLILQFKNSHKNTLVFRKGVKEFWDLNFNAAKNYKMFSSQIGRL